jgi:pilus assembly protein CpaB
VSPARLFVHRFRRPLAAASAALAVLLMAVALRPAAPPLVDVAVAAADLPPGSTLTESDLAIEPLPVVYAGAAIDVDQAIGRTLATGIRAGEPITESRLVTTEPRADGLRAVPVRLADAEVADLLSPGAVIDLVLSSRDGGDRVVAEGVQVVTIPRRANPSGLGSPTRNAGSLVVVATDHRTAVELAAVGAQPGLGVVLR